MGPDRSIHIESMEGDLISHINSTHLSQIHPSDSENPIKTCIVKRIPIHIEYKSVNVKYGSDWNDFLEKTNSASLLLLPLLNNDQCTGILGIHSKAFNSFTDNIECSLLALVAQYLSDHYEIQRRIRDYSILANQSKLMTVIFDTVQEGIIITDAQGRIVSVNPALTQITGYSSEELIGQMPSILQSGIHDKNFYSAMWQKITDTGQWEGEVWNKRKNNSIYPESLCITTVKDNHQATINYIGILTDNSKQRKIEQ